MSAIIPQGWVSWALGGGGEKGELPQLTIDVLASRDANASSAKKAQTQLGKLVNRSRHEVYIASLEELPENARTPQQGDPVGMTESRTLAMARYRSIS